MNLEKNNVYYNFCLEEIKIVDELNLECYLFKHKKNNAKLLYIKNDDSNKVFYVAFKTPPQNSCGTPHILEHSVLCGSLKYPLKDPFNELSKSSLNTYLNALTYGDKTMYPVASCNDADFNNLVDVYLDAVFKPLIHENKYAFMQEGWHYNLEDLDAPLKINGIVYNEMKGALSNTDSILFNAINESIYNEGTYGLSSGGDPKVIPNLSYEDFTDFHKKYYHPSNSYFYLYGDLDIFSYLKKIDENYLEGYEKFECDSSIKEPKKYGTDGEMIVKAYKPDDSKTLGYFSYNILVGKCYDKNLNISLDILSNILSVNNNSPIKKALIEKGVCQEVEVFYNASYKDCYFSFVAKNLKKDDENEFKKIINETLDEIVSKGFDYKLVKSSVNVFEFFYREEDFGYKPTGLFYGTEIMKCWLHDENNPFEGINHLKCLENIKKEIPNAYFENLVKKYLINPKITSFVYLKPDNNFSELGISEEQLLKIKESFTKEQLLNIIEEKNELLKYQNEEEIHLDKIPTLDIKDIKKAPNIKIINKKDNLLHLSMDTKNILFSKIIINLDNCEIDFSKDDLNYLGLLSGLLNRLGTVKYCYDDLQSEIFLNTGGIYATLQSINKTKLENYLIINGKCFIENADNMFDILEEIIFNTDFTNVKNLRDILQEHKSRLTNSLTTSSHLYAINRSNSYFKESGVFSDKTKGLDFYNFINKIDTDDENSLLDIYSNLKKIAHKIFNKKNVEIALCCNDCEFEAVKSKALSFIELFEDKKYLENKICKARNINEAFIINSAVNFNIKSGDFKKFGAKYSGSMNVLKSIISREYLWNNIRVKGGSYGCGCVISRSGVLNLYSYRDPKVAETYDCYNNISKFLKDTNIDDNIVKKYIIGAIREIDKPKSTDSTFSEVILRYLSEISIDIINTQRIEILETTSKDIKNYSEFFENIINQNYFCTIGVESEINNNKDIFENIIKVATS